MSAERSNPTSTIPVSSASGSPRRSGEESSAAVSGGTPASFEALLTTEGRTRWSWLQTVVRGTPDTVPTLRDAPATSDQLERVAFARGMAMRLRRIREEERASVDEGAPMQGLSPPDGAFLLHLHGPWGSGKTSLLNLLSEELRSGDESSRWVVVTFNAWQHQRLGSPWWWLMHEVYRQGVKQIHPGHWWRLDQPSGRRAFLIRVGEYGWRFFAGRVRYVVVLLLVVAFLIAAWLLGWFNPLLKWDLGEMAKRAQALGAIIALVLTIGGIAQGLNRFLLLNSARAARSFMETAQDPMRSLTRHFKALVSWLGQPLAIFIDDLDRCERKYVLELLEGIQTMFREPAVMYVVAADRRWLTACYEDGYHSFLGIADNPGRPLGYLFLEKIFQLSTSVPSMQPATRDRYWQRLIGVGTGDSESVDAARKEAAARMRPLSSEEEVMAIVQREGDPSTAYGRAIRGAAVVQLATPKVAERIEHALKAFGPFLEPNPRAMKRLVNAYGVQRDIAILAGADIERQKLALWTIASLRWPILAEYLEMQPEMVSNIQQKTSPPGVSPGLADLFKDPRVYEVFTGGDLHVGLDAQDVADCAGLRTSRRTATVVA